MSQNSPSVFYAGSSIGTNPSLEKSLSLAVSELGGTLYFPGDSFGNTGAFLDHISSSSVVVFDLSDRNPNVMFELGYAQALGKPTVLLAKSAHSIPFDISNQRYLIYGSFEHEDTLKRVLVDLLEAALKQGTTKPAEERKRDRGDKVFISYSHQDKPFLDRLMVHLRPLQKQGIIDVWADTRISPGEKWKEEITKALETASVALLLISADFLASDFIVDDELPPLLKAAEDRGTVILPLILKPCRFSRDPHLKHFQALNDPRHSIITLREDEQESLYDSVAEAIEKTVPKE